MAMIDKVCEYCGSPFQIERWRLNQKGAKGRFCSRKCSTRSLFGKEYVSLVCPTCGVEFEVKPVIAERGRTYCSWQCFLDRSERARVEIQCNWCGENFLTWPCRLKEALRHFCSRECTELWLKNGGALNGPDHPNWQDGASLLPYGPGFTPSLKRRIRERDEYTCAVCGGEGREVHHIDYDKYNHHEDNLITLCGSCHGKTSRGDREHWYEYFTSID